MSDNTPITAEQILAMEPGREMDAHVAKYVKFPGHSHPISEVKEWCAKYSTDIAAAWEIVEKMQGIQDFNGKKVRLHVTVSAIRGTYTALISDYLNDRVIAEQMGSTAPEAICRAALLARLEAHP
ncbi:hypothetical protein ACFSR7_12535 [Cohnella sp. GCM10020058]|uniref:BC1872 family protein n=1 Tax=Cohnella sp. GCM10020058 TaxID=3317330 RepID=UPI003638B568